MGVVSDGFWKRYASPEELTEVQKLEPVIEAGMEARKKWQLIYNRCKQRQQREPRDVIGVKR